VLTTLGAAAELAGVDLDADLRPALNLVAGTTTDVSVDPLSATDASPARTCTCTCTCTCTSARLPPR
jgi:hypothetical protein